MKIKRILALTVCLLLTFGLFAGCNSGGSSSSTPASTDSTADSSTAPESTPASTEDSTAEERSTASTGVVLRIFNSKGENAAEFEQMCKDFEAETGIVTEPFSVGSGTDAAEPLRIQMASSTPPAVFSMQGLKELISWTDQGTVLDLNEVENADLKAIVDAIPQELRLTMDGTAHYGIPYNVEGYGYIVDSLMLDDMFEEGSAAALPALRTADYDNFVTFVEAVDTWINAPAASTVSINGTDLTFKAEKTGRTEKLTGVFAFAGSEKWTYGDHKVNVALNAVLANAAAGMDVTDEQFDQLHNPLVAYAKSLDLESSHVGGLNGAAGRGQDLISSANFGYDQSVQMLVDGTSVFLQQGNWVAGNISTLDSAVADRVSFIPLKMPITDDMIKTDHTAAQFASTIPVFVPNYYGINKNVSAEERAAAEQFLAWMGTPENIQKYVIDAFKFIPYNADSSMTITDALSSSIMTYLEEGGTLGVPYHGAPGQWSGDTFGAYVMENYLTKAEWAEADYEDIANYAVSSWKELLANA
ncbi:MAG: extracellular solute-binding protein [Oscillospiraceae bacterium]